MNAIWAGSHLHVKGGLSGGRTSTTTPTYEIATSHQAVPSKSPPLAHQPHTFDGNTTTKTTPKHTHNCAMRKKEKRAKSHDEIDKLRITTHETVRLSNSSSGIHSYNHFLTPELGRKNPCHLHPAKKKYASDIKKDRSHSFTWSPPTKSKTAEKFNEKQSDKTISKRSQQTENAHQRTKVVQNSSAKPGGVQSETNPTTRGCRSFIFKETSV